MKISVHLEADSAEELLAFFETFHVKSVKPETADAFMTTAEITEMKAFEEPPPALVEEQPVEKKARKPRGPNKPKQAPVDETPSLSQPIQASPMPPITPPVRSAPKPETPQVTRDDLLNVFSEYVQRYGVSFGYTDISSLLQQHLGDGIRKASDVPEGQLLEAIDAIKAAISENPFNRKRDYA